MFNILKQNKQLKRAIHRLDQQLTQLEELSTKNFETLNTEIEQRDAMINELLSMTSDELIDYRAEKYVEKLQPINYEED